VSTAVSSSFASSSRAGDDGRDDPDLGRQFLDRRRERAAIELTLALVRVHQREGDDQANILEQPPAPPSSSVG
jgi:hypothetical protein